MKYSTRLADSVHLMVLIALQESDCSSTGIANSLATNPAHVRRLMAKLKKGGLLLSCRGKAEPFLVRDPKEISLLDIYRVIEEGNPLLHLDTHTNPDCNNGVHIQLALQECYDRLQDQFEKEMSGVSLQEVIDRYRNRIQGLEKETPSV